MSDVIEHAQLRVAELGQSRQEEIRIEPAQRLEPPDTYYFPSGFITAVKCTITGRQGRHIGGNVRVDPNFFAHPVVYTNVLTGETNYFTIDRLPLGVKRVSPGEFYFIYHPLNYYYCDRIQGETVQWHLIESFQSGEKITGTFTQNVNYSTTYIPVSDKKIIKRLQRRLEEYLWRSRKDQVSDLGARPPRRRGEN